MHKNKIQYDMVYCDYGVYSDSDYCPEKQHGDKTMNITHMKVWYSVGTILAGSQNVFGCVFMCQGCCFWPFSSCILHSLHTHTEKIHSEAEGTSKAE